MFWAGIPKLLYLCLAMMTNRYPSEWLAKAEQGLARIAERPWTLFLLLFCVNTLAQPYAGITHDARLYSVQVLNSVEDGTYADDLFFRYGSQDDYSLFSRLAAPLVRWFGLPAAFFLIYLLSKSLLLWGMIRIVQTLVPNRAASALALFYCMAFTIHYGGHHKLYVQEAFVTPRMLACALVLIGFDLLLRRRPLLSCVAIVFAVGVHPLMACGGLLIWAGYHVWTHLGIKTFAGALASACGLAIIVLAVEPLGKRCFGEMDDFWRESIMQASPFNFPSLWDWSDWLGLAFQLAILGTVIWKYRYVNADKARFLIVLMIVTLAGAVGAILAEQLPYALFFQGQPYRALWMLAFLHLAFVFWLCAEWSKHASLLGRLAGCVLLAYLCCVNAMAAEYALPVLLFPILAVAARGLEKEPRHPAWLTQSIQLSLVLGGLGWAAYKLSLLVRGYEELVARHAEYRDVLEVLLRSLGPIVFCAVICGLLVRTTRHRKVVGSRFNLNYLNLEIKTTPDPFSVPRSAWCAAMAAGCLGAQVFYYAFPETDFYLERCTHYRGDLRTVHEMLHRDRAPTQPLPTVYCNLGCLDYVWLELHSKSYFDWWQAGNYMFRREMAMEGRRRARLVGPCEIAHYRRFEDQLSAGFKDLVARFFQTNFERAPLNKDDLARLCQEPNLDYLVLDEHIAGLNAVQVGRLYVYSCQDVRAALQLPVLSLGDRLASGER
jgi:hypothetical protein